MEEGKYLRFDPNRAHEKVNRIISLQRENDIIAMVLEGKESAEIRKYLVARYRLTPLAAQQTLNKARGELKKRKNWEVDTLVSLHIVRWEQMFALLNRIGAWSLAARALKGKETLLGFHRAGFHMRVTQGEIQQVQMEYVDNEYDLSKLSVTEQNRVHELFEKMKRVKTWDMYKKKKKKKKQDDNSEGEESD